MRGSCRSFSCPVALGALGVRFVTSGRSGTSHFLYAAGTGNGRPPDPAVPVDLPIRLQGPALRS
eukprot:7227110-Prymnesium_polylepis.1